MNVVRLAHLDRLPASDAGSRVGRRRGFDHHERLPSGCDSSSRLDDFPMLAQNVSLIYVLCVAPRALKPDWNGLFEVAAAQSGYFTTQQAAEVGYSTHLLHSYIGTGRVERARRGIYRLIHFPAMDHEELVVAWLWSEQAGVVSHQTALSLHQLSDALPPQLHLSVPSDWITRRLRVPSGVVLHYANVPASDRAWFGSVPTTNPRRTLNDCAREGVSPELLRQGAQQALGRGLVTRAELSEVETALEPFGGLAA